MEPGGERVAQLSYNGKGQLELAIPYGMKTAELAKLREALFTDLIGRLPRGCPACLSGDNLVIRERFEHVVQIDLDRMDVIG
jgi:hypothetical protein